MADLTSLLQQVAAIPNLPAPVIALLTEVVAEVQSLPILTDFDQLLTKNADGSYSLNPNVKKLLASLLTTQPVPVVTTPVVTAPVITAPVVSAPAAVTPAKVGGAAATISLADNGPFTAGPLTMFKTNNFAQLRVTLPTGAKDAKWVLLYEPPGNNCFFPNVPAGQKETTQQSTYCGRMDAFGDYQWVNRHTLANGQPGESNVVTVTKVNRDR